jgi:pimeloyl-ACP methyl ester carboxylesterase
MPHQTRFTRSGNAHIAYQVVGEGSLDLVFVPGWVSHVELAWEEPTRASFLERLASFSRLIVFDKRGTGLSDQGRRQRPGRPHHRRRRQADKREINPAHVRLESA